MRGNYGNLFKARSGPEKQQKPCRKTEVKESIQKKFSGTARLCLPDPDLGRDPQSRENRSEPKNQMIGAGQD